MNNSYSRNIPLYYASILFRAFFMLVSINVLYYLANGLSLTQVLFLASVLSIGSVLFDVPTGIFADKEGRKVSILISGLLLVIGYILLSFGGSFWMFLVAMVAMAASGSFLSGADSALVYDSLVAQRLENHYTRVETAAKTFSLVAGALAAVAGSYLYSIEIHLPYYCMVLLASLCFLCYALMREPPITSREPQSMRQYLKKSIALIQEDQTLTFLMLFEAFVFATVNISYRFFQPLMQAASIPLALFGLIYMGIMLFSALIVYLQPLIEHALEKRLGKDATLWWFPALIGVGFLALAGRGIFLFIGLFITQMLLTYLSPLMKIKVQARIPSRERATLLSVMSFLGNLLLLIIAPVFGFLADTLGIALCLIILAAFGMVTTFTVLIWHASLSASSAGQPPNRSNGRSGRGAA